MMPKPLLAKWQLGRKILNRVSGLLAVSLGVVRCLRSITSNSSPNWMLLPTDIQYSFVTTPCITDRLTPQRVRQWTSLPKPRTRRAALMSATHKVDEREHYGSWRHRLQKA